MQISGGVLGLTSEKEDESEQIQVSEFVPKSCGRVAYGAVAEVELGKTDLGKRTRKN